MSVYDEFCTLFNVCEEADIGFLQSLEPQRKRQPKKEVPLEIRQTEKYQQRRLKNTLAARHNRKMKKLKEKQSVLFLKKMERENKSMQGECEKLRKELSALIHLVRKKDSTK
jgi:hypothetical protein